MFAIYAPSFKEKPIMLKSYEVAIEGDRMAKRFKLIH